MTLGAAFEGAGAGAGGVVAALFDEAMGFVLSIACTPAYTGKLEVIARRRGRSGSRSRCEPGSVNARAAS